MAITIRARISWGSHDWLTLEAFIRGRKLGGEARARLEASLFKGRSLPRLPESLTLRLARYWKFEISPDGEQATPEYQPAYVVFGVPRRTRTALGRETTRRGSMLTGEVGRRLELSMQGRMPNFVAKSVKKLEAALPEEVEWGARLPDDILDLLLKLRADIKDYENPKSKCLGGKVGGIGVRIIR